MPSTVKPACAALALLVLSALRGHGATVIVGNPISFSGGTGGQAVSITFNQAISIPLTVSGNFTFFGFVLEDVYSSPQGNNSSFPQTNFGTPGAISGTLYRAASGTSIQATFYNAWGTVPGPYGIIDSNDFYGLFYLPTSYAAGDTFTISPGTLVIDGDNARPNRPVTSIQWMVDGDGLAASEVVAVIPEPSVGIPVLLGVVSGLRRRRRP